MNARGQLRISLAAVLLLVVLNRQALAFQPGNELPRVVLLGDSIRLGYAPLVTERLKGQAVIVSPPANGGDSRNLLENVSGWVANENPAVVCFNCGLHDLKHAKATRRNQVDLADYEGNLRKIVAVLRKQTNAALLFVSTTPILDARHAGRKADFDRHEAEVLRYNEVAFRVMREEGVPVNDLHWVVEQFGPDKLLAADGTHFTPAGYQCLAEAMADSILRQLTIRRRSSTPPSAAPIDATTYEKAQTRNSSLVPPAYKNLAVGRFALPENAGAWTRQRPGVLDKVLASLGSIPPRPSPQRVRRITREWRRGYWVEKVAIDNGVDGEISALLLIPEKLPKPAPAILWLHSSTPDKTQILVPDTNGGAEPLGEVFVRAGYVVLAPDAYWHGDRVGTGPAGSAEKGREEQESLFKLNLWMGRTLWGMFVRDDQIALDFLCSRPEVDRTRIGATGMSMGSTRAWWLAAVDERVAATVGVACLTRYQNLIAHGGLRQHGVYYFVNGLLQHFDTEGVLALLAPRPFLALTGELDAGSPADGIKILEDQVGQVYRAVGAAERFRSIRYPGIGHVYTSQMRTEMLAWFARWLGAREGQKSAERK
jgi:dienelactone hydrolase/lysophospholipase L1-like esterase